MTYLTGGSAKGVVMLDADELAAELDDCGMPSQRF
jgi:hypothetical protein